MFQKPYQPIVTDRVEGTHQRLPITATSQVRRRFCVNDIPWRDAISKSWGDCDGAAFNSCSSRFQMAAAPSFRNDGRIGSPTKPIARSPRAMKAASVVSRRSPICSTCERSWTLSSTANRHRGQSQSSTRRAIMQLQLNLVFLELDLSAPPPPQASKPAEVTMETREAAVGILARILAQTAEVNHPTTEASDE